MARHLRKHNRQFYTFGATKVPSVTQDRYYSADWVRDMRYNEQLAARAMLDLLGVSSVLVSGGLVTQGSSVTKANITAAVGFCDFDVEVPADDTAWSVPVAFETRQIAVTARSPALTDFDLSTTSMVFDGSTPNYLKLKYLENNVKSRTRKYGATAYSYSVEDSYAIVCDTSAVTAKDILLATLVGNGTSTLTITQNVNTAKVLKATNADSATTSLYGMNFDYVVDSDAKFLEWQGKTSGCEKVLVRKGTWTLATGLIPLSTTGTKVVIGESGSRLVFGNSQRGLYYSSIPTTLDYYMNGVNVSCTSSANLLGWGFENCANLTNCTGYGAGGGYATGSGFKACTRLVNCSGTGISLGTGTGSGFYVCTNLTNCIGTGDGATLGAGFHFCSFITNCKGFGTGLIKHAYSNCKNMQQNKIGDETTYDTCYSDSGTGYPVADTPNGGFNS